LELLAVEQRQMSGRRKDFSSVMRGGAPISACNSRLAAGARSTVERTYSRARRVFAWNSPRDPYMAHAQQSDAGGRGGRDVWVLRPSFLAPTPIRVLHRDESRERPTAPRPSHGLDARTARGQRLRCWKRG
jgi:hypothetical protein